MSKYNKLYSKFGETTEAIIKYKKEDISKLSERYEKEAKRQSEIEKEKAKKRKQMIKEREQQAVLFKETKDKVSPVPMLGQLHHFILRNLYKRRLRAIIIAYQEEKLLEMDKDELEKLDKNKDFTRRETHEQKEIEGLIKQFKDFYQRDYHYFYDYPYKKPKLSISCFKEKEEIKPNPSETRHLDEDYEAVYKKGELLSTKNLQRYDCWEDKSPQEWIEICKNSGRKSHGLSPNYKKGS